ncbi:hypothetical protein HBH70_115680 [Parastagonospora nodorum]|nr:hypothetical protein HBH74_160790 [Parastagonospora nodorum]KAH4991803.1 hypothetical protein HBH73_020710 [Parastagonospora nodorum]KAH5123577.1 hypothetical protein HBH71_026120 [Parastagonospora nodorum]KAH5137213.1 hypothetical protein HBH70_115680 [Parastagonospora nodorum]KAH5166401.1 hypothetical protein HBI73_022700 [Parastagonospora nodorum]
MYPSSPPVANLTRPRLKALARWVRDELDLLVAREGPNILRPDDVLILHETFIALRLATDITALDIRATGIHFAVQDIAGVATRWPGRLCDDCDKIIAIWTEKFGSLKNLHPFMYGRGGRLEGIAGPTEYSREALLKRWSEQCPERLHPKVSHRLGDLGFRPGDWWISTLFAHHAGIIGLEAVEGGTTFDKYGAYALVLKDTGEVEASRGETFTYRTSQHDKGRFRLTAATPRSRDPIRVLRSHSMNSVWGPKAGVRYEGLFSIRGWSIRQAKASDTAGQWKEGDILFEIRFERTDPVPFSEVTCRPTATEVDDYTEYKRLRKLHRDDKRNADLRTDFSTSPLQLATKAAPAIPSPISPLLPGPAAPKILYKGLLQRSATSKQAHFEDISEIRRTNDVPTPASHRTTETDYFALSPRKESTLLVPGYKPPSPSNASIASGHTGATGASTQSNIRDVAPWIDFDADLTAPDAVPEDAAAPALDPSPTLTSSARLKTWQRPARDSPPVSPLSERRRSGDFKTFLRVGSKRQPIESSRKSVFVRAKNPMAKLFDGAASEEAEGALARGAKSEEEEESARVHSPIPMRPFSPESPLAMGRRGAVYEGQDGDSEISGEHDPFVETRVLVAQHLDDKVRRTMQIGIGAQNVAFRFPNWAASAREKEKRDSLDVDKHIAPDDVGEQH